ncbi:Zdhhc16 [Nucleospora cyclopteri]
MKLIQRKEKIFRLIAYGILIYMCTIPLFFYVYYSDNDFARVTVVLLPILCVCGIFYATLTILIKGYVIEEHMNEDEIPSEFVRRCNFCNAFKPERSHHCKICRKCILKMDHHCNILSVCVNYQNHGHFIRFLFFTWASSVLLFSYTVYHIYRTVLDTNNEISYGLCVFIVINALISGFVVLLTTIHLYWQVSNIQLNVTNIEAIQEHNSMYRNINCGKSPYNFGFYYNFCDVMGPLRKLFLASPSGNGVVFKKSYKTYYWPLNDIKEFRNTDIELI